MEKALASGFGWTAGYGRKAGKRDGRRFRDTVRAIGKIINGTPEEGVPDERDLYINVCGCAVSASSLPDFSLIL